MKNQIRLTRANQKRVDCLLEHTTRIPVHSKQTMTSLSNLAMEFGWDAVESMFGFTKTKKAKS